MVFEDFIIRSKESSDICIHAVSAISHFLWAMAHGHTPEELGINAAGAGRLRCPDPGPPDTQGGSVLFDLRRVD